MFRKNAKKEWQDFIALNILTLFVIFLILVFGGCGTGVGNPEGNATPLFAPTDENFNVEPNFDAPIDEYNSNTAHSQPNGVDCLSFTQASSLGDVNAGRSCIRNALDNCNPARYLLDEITGSGSRFVSFVSVEITQSAPLSCQLRVHTVSDDSARFVGDEEKTCDEVSANEVLELACGIGTQAQ